MIQIGLDENTNDAYSFTTVVVEPNGLFSIDTVKPDNDLYLRDTTILDEYTYIRQLEDTEVYGIFKTEINKKESHIMRNGVITYNIDRDLDTNIDDELFSSSEYQNLSNLSIVDNAEDITLTLNDPIGSGAFDIKPYIVNASNLSMTVSGNYVTRFAINYGFLGGYINISNIGNAYTFKLITNSNKIGTSTNISYARTVNMQMVPFDEMNNMVFEDYVLLIEFDYTNSDIIIHLEFFDNLGDSIYIKEFLFDISEILSQDTLTMWGSYNTLNASHLDLTIRLNATCTKMYQDPLILTDFDYDLHYSVDYDLLYFQKDQLQFSNLIFNGSVKSIKMYTNSIQYHNSYSVINGDPLNIGMFDYYYLPIMNMYSIRPKSSETITFRDIKSYVISSGNLINASHPDSLDKVQTSLGDNSFNITIENTSDTKQKIISYSQAGSYVNHRNYLEHVGILRRLSDESRFELYKAFKKETALKVRGVKLVCTAFNVINPSGNSISSKLIEANKEIYTDINYEYEDMYNSEILFDDVGMTFNVLLPAVNTKLKRAHTFQLLNTVSVIGVQIQLLINDKLYPITVNLTTVGKILPPSKIIPLSVKVVLHGGKF